MSPQMITLVNAEFKVRVKYDSEKRNRLIGAGQLPKHIGEELANKLSQEAIDSGLDLYTRKLRRGVRVEFQAH